jgi:glyoxylase-like metal-dependent hydrolase (beta-lactamase superfamily II)
MKRILTLLIACATVSAFAADNDIVPKGSIVNVGKMQLKGIGNNTFIVVDAYPWPSNSLVTVFDNGEVLFIDTPYTPEATSQLISFVHSKIKNAKITAVNTHFHIDRLGGNKAFIDNGIPVYGSSLTVRMIDERGKSSIQATLGWIKDPEIRAYHEKFAFVKPDHVFNEREGKKLTFGKETAEIVFHGGGHSFDNCVLYLPSKKIIFGGCLVFSLDKTNTGNTADADLAAWKSTLEKIRTAGYSVVVPGHGESGGTDLIAHTIRVVGNK